MSNARAAEGAIACRVDSVEGAAAAIAARIGIGYLPCLLETLLADWCALRRSNTPSDRGLWLLTHPDIRRLERVNTFMSFCASELAKKRRQIEGTLAQVVDWNAGGYATSRTARHSAPAE